MVLGAKILGVKTIRGETFLNQKALAASPAGVHPLRRSGTPGSGAPGCPCRCIRIRVRNPRSAGHKSSVRRASSKARRWPAPPLGGSGCGSRAPSSAHEGPRGCSARGRVGRWVGSDAWWAKAQHPFRVPRWRHPRGADLKLQSCRSHPKLLPGSLVSPRASETNDAVRAADGNSEAETYVRSHHISHTHPAR